MIAKNLSRALIVASAFLALNTMANTLPAAALKEMMTPKMMDTNKDGMVSRAEFVEMMGKIYDMKAAEMKVKDKLDAGTISALLREMAQAAGNSQ